MRPFLDGFHLYVRSVPGLGQPWLPDCQKVFLLSLSPQRKFPREPSELGGGDEKGLQSFVHLSRREEDFPLNLKAYLNNVSDYGQESHHLMPSGFCEEVYQSKYNQKTEITEKFEKALE